MSVEKIFGEWNSHPTQGRDDNISRLWNLLSAQGVNTADFRPNFGLSQRRAEITMLWDLYVRAQPQVVVEIGVAQSGTFAAWCYLGRDDATIIGIDRDLRDSRPRPGDPGNPEIYTGDLKFFEDGGGIRHLVRGAQSIHGVSGWSYDERVLHELTAILNGRKIDFLFHDASHSESMARKDFDLFWPLVAEGGIMAFHDIQESKAPDCDKSEWWKWAKANAEYSACFEFRGSKNDDSLGIGVLIK